MSRPTDGYPVPDPVDPGDYSCFRVYVPRDTLYIGAFWTAYQYFTSWIAWARDPLKKGKQAAEVWRRGYDIARQEFERTKGVCTMAIINIRAKPLNPCIIQYQTDDNVWHDGPDVSCCSGGGGGGCGDAYRIGADGSVERYDPATDSWSNTAPGITPGDAQNIPAAFPDDPEGRCKAANAYMGYIKDYLEKILTTAGLALQWGDYFLVAFSWLNIIFSVVEPIIETLTQMLQVVYNSEEGVNSARLAARDNAAMICYFYQRFSPDGTMTAENVVRLTADLQAAADEEADDNIKWWYQHAADLVSIFGKAGADKGAAYANPETQSCDTCPTTVHLDFTKQAWGFEFVKEGGYYCGKRTTAGWLGTENPGAGWGGRWGVSLAMLCQEIHINTITVFWTPLAETILGGQRWDVWMANASDFQGGGPEGVNVEHQSGPYNINYGFSNIMLRSSEQLNGAHGTGANSSIRELDITFTGPIPPAWLDAVV